MGAAVGVDADGAITSLPGFAVDVGEIERIAGLLIMHRTMHFQSFIVMTGQAGFRAGVAGDLAVAISACTVTIDAGGGVFNSNGDAVCTCRANNISNR